ncbi:YtzI protein [Lysinibacillus irui]|uniref:YtzI protein n=1 Tax=Lysinibacillus irui TaxID=2998077 RepID=A0AAJ5USG5_9BACI|nr:MULTISPECIES: YtzI protein [Lysinibacillus]MEA0555406.1 YtzI protein [Lysinibacillus irui]MEA0564790.1 YtzI protein [Lysinibacillus irui]MEA0976991.1 YtzI protein [Lysinibacillus irui]MEA1043145.1 YtzI protein [Lysinibacillus irui]WDV05979.1 YtzI protein [Lysinibacillus irui]
MSLTTLLIIAVIIVIVITIATIISVNRAYAFKHTIDERPKQNHQEEP